MSELESGSREALRRLIALLEEVDSRWLSPEWNLNSADDIAQGTRALMHMLQGGLDSFFECDPIHPDFRKIVTPYKKFTGDNADAIYYDAPIDPRCSYEVKGNLSGAVYTAFTVECGVGDGRMGTRLGGVLNDSEIDIDAAGNFSIRLGGAPQERNWIPLPDDAFRITTRHYFEEKVHAAVDTNRHCSLSIRNCDAAAPPPAPSDPTVAAGIDRVGNFIRSRTLEQPAMADAETPAFVSKVPGVFPAPVSPGDHGLAASDAAYSMAPFFLGPDQALVMTTRWPECRCANVVLWNRHMQTFDYVNRTISLNRKQAVLEEDGLLRIIVAPSDPGHPNWLDTEGRALGLVFWRFMLPEGSIETPVAEVVSMDSLVGSDPPPSVASS